MTILEQRKKMLADAIKLKKKRRALYIMGNIYAPKEVTDFEKTPKEYYKNESKKK